MTFTNIVEFNAALDRAGRNLTEQQFNMMIRKIALLLLRAIVLRTPVKTGRARANWQVTINTPDIETLPDNVTDKSGGSAISKGNQVIGILRGMSFEQIEKIFISNNVEYIIDLEDGSSTQAPAGMVVLSVAQISEVFA